MNKRLLEAIIRESVQQILEAFPPDDTIGAAAPPAGGLGTGDQPALAPSTPMGPDTRGVWFVDPRKTDKPLRINLQGKDQPKIERELYQIAAKSAGPRVKVSSETLRQVPQIMANPNASIFLYVGKRTPEDPDTELNLLPAKTLQQAQAASVSNSSSSDPSQPNTVPQPQDPASQQAPPEDVEEPEVPEEEQPQGKTVAPDIDETVGSVMRRSQLNELISYLVKETFDSLDSFGLGTSPEMQQLAGDPITDPVELQRQELERRKMSRQKLQGLQKIQKIETDKNRADQKTWKLKKRSFDKTIRDLKRTGV
jgi:hypothetical protein